MNNVTFGTGRVGYYETVAGGAGAGPGWGGRSGVHTHMTNTRITDPEILELRWVPGHPSPWGGLGGSWDPPEADRDPLPTPPLQVPCGAAALRAAPGLGWRGAMPGG